MEKDYKSTITITFGDAGENHVGMQQLGKKLDKGFTYEDLKQVQDILSGDGDYVTELIDLESFLPVELRTPETKGASILIMRDILPVSGLEHHATFETLKALHWDSKFYSAKHGGVANKKARWNNCFGDFSQVADIPNKKGTVHDFKDVPCLQTIRADMAQLLGDRVSTFIGEGNYYYQASSCGIGYHSDAERRCVIAFRFGKEMSMCFHWYLNSNRVGTKATFTIKGGDGYIMSEMAVGSKVRKTPTLRHAAGCKKYIE